MHITYCYARSHHVGCAACYAASIAILRAMHVLELRHIIHSRPHHPLTEIIMYSPRSSCIHLDHMYGVPRLHLPRLHISRLRCGWCYRALRQQGSICQMISRSRRIATGLTTIRTTTHSGIPTQSRICTCSAGGCGTPRVWKEFRNAQREFRNPLGREENPLLRAGPRPPTWA